MPVKEILGNQIRELVYIFVLLLATSNASKEIIKQDSGSIDQTSNKWEREDQNDCGLRWKEKREDGTVYYDTCKSVTTGNKPCNLTTENWVIPAEVNSVFIEVGGTWHNCTQCTPHFDLLVKFPAKSSSYVQVMKLPQKTALKKDKFFSYDDSIEVPVNGYRNMTLKFRTTYFCGDISKVRLYYLRCPSRSKELVTFSSKPAPTGSNNLTIQGYCTAGSDPDPSNQAREPYMICRPSGDPIIHGKCLCKAGHFPKDNECKECGNNEFKSTIGNVGCDKCGKSSTSEKFGKTKCECKNSHYRETGKEENYNETCYRLPDAPSDLTIKDVTNEKANISWSKPAHGSAPLGKYFIDCLNCPADEKTFPVNTTDTSIHLSGLKPAASYKLQIYNKNSITGLVKNEGFWNKEIFYLNTTSGGKPGRIQQLKHVVNENSTVTLTWNPPFYKGGDDLVYEIHYGKQTHKTKDTKWTIETGTEDKIYIVKIYATAVVKGIRVKGDVVNSQEITVKGGIPLPLTIAVAASVIVLVILVLVASFCVWKKRHPSYLQVVRMENGAVQLPHKFFSHAKLYVDPTTYNAVDEAVQEFAKEIDRKDLTVGEQLGGGEFAEVFKGLLYRNGAYKDVAIKTLKSGVVSKRDRDDFFGEAAILGQFSDCTNVVKLEGVVLKDRPNWIILEYMKNGALDSYLQKNDNKFDVTQLLGMARCVANGMTYLSEIGFIHRDLAARNILVDEFNVCKVSDFGMSREIKLDDTYDTQGGKIPVRWTAPEAIQYKKFTSASDIWSYGILLWEIMSFGERPYWDWGNYTVLERLNAGYRLPPPMNCPKVIHDLMLKCWHKDRTKRPKFKEIGDQIEQWIRTPLLLRGVAATVVRKRDENLDYTVLETINKWLEAIGMDRYTETFLTNGYSTPRQVLNLTMDDLEKLEIGPIGHKKKIYKAIQNTKEQVESRHNSSSEKTAKKYNLPNFKK